MLCTKRGKFIVRIIKSRRIEDGCVLVNPSLSVMEDREKVEKYQLRLLKALGKDMPVAATKNPHHLKIVNLLLIKKHFLKSRSC